MTFKIDNRFNSSHKMGEAKINYHYALGKFGEGETDSGDGKCSNLWEGEFTALDGTVMRASMWDYKGSLLYAGYVSVWVSNPAYLDEFIKWIQT